MTALRDEYTAKVHQEIDDLNAKVDVLESKMHETQADMRGKYRSELASLRHQSQLAKDKLEAVKSSGEDAWDKLVAEMDKLRTAFRQSVNYFKSQF